LARTDLKKTLQSTKNNPSIGGEQQIKALVLNGSESGASAVNPVSDYLVDFLRIKGIEVDVIVLRDEKIAGCLGCFGCWLRTPGECVINDAGRDLPRKVMQSDLVFLLTPVTFGMYSYQLKKAFDRIPCPLLLPFFANINGEIHHAERYGNYPSFVAIGVLPNPDEECEGTFTALVGRNGINLHASNISSIIYSTDNPDAIKEKVKTTLSKAGVR
jgi:multimeric flavodoxin WrbA